MGSTIVKVTWKWERAPTEFVETLEIKDAGGAETAHQKISQDPEWRMKTIVRVETIQVKP